MKMLSIWLFDFYSTDISAHLPDINNINKIFSADNKFVSKNYKNYLILL